MQNNQWKIIENQLLHNSIWIRVEKTKIRITRKSEKKKRSYLIISIPEQKDAQ